MVLDVTKSSESLVLFSLVFFSSDDRPPSTGDNEKQPRDRLDIEFGSEAMHQRNRVLCLHALNF
jgi:hypothetical protein